MVTQQIQKAPPFSDQETEDYIKNMLKELTEFCEIQGRQHGSDNRPKTIDEHKALIVNHIEIQTQTGLDFVKKKFLLIAGEAGARLAQAEGEKQEKAAQSEMHDLEHALLLATKEAEALKPTSKANKYDKVAIIAVGIIALFEGSTAYPAFRHIHIPTLSATLASVGITVGAAFGAHFSGKYIKAAKNEKETTTRWVTCMAPAAAAFSAMGCMRAAAYNYSSNLKVGAEHPTQSIWSAVGIATISIVMYALGIWLSSKFSRTKEEKNRQDTYDEKCKEVDGIQAKIDGLKDLIVKIRYEKAARIDRAMAMFEYAGRVDTMLINCADQSAEAYKQKNLRFRSDACPAFFSNKPVFNFRRSFNAVNNNNANFNNHKNNQNNEQTFEIN